MVIGIILAVIIGVILIGVVFHLLKFAIIIALAAGVVMIARNHFGTKRIK